MGLLLPALDWLILKTIVLRQCAAYTLMCCYTWYNWLVIDADARGHLEKKQRTATLRRVFLIDAMERLGQRHQFHTFSWFSFQTEGGFAPHPEATAPRHHMN